MRGMESSVEIARKTKLQDIQIIAEKAGLGKNEIELWGGNKAKVFLDVFNRLKKKEDGKLILVTTINPTPAGEGKTTTTIGLAQALARLSKNTMLGIREPSLGPCMGIKGGAAGGGYSQVLPMEDINLHFTGDMNAVAASHNLLAALLNNHLHYGNELHIDPRRILWHRVMDVDDRALRNIVVGLGGRKDGVPHEDSFDITAASEVMAILCLSKDLMDIKNRLSKIIMAYTLNGDKITSKDLRSVGAAAMLLKHAIKPNLVQTIEGVPAFVHGGPFANIAHGTSSLISTTMGLKLSDYFVTEAGFGSDLGAEKFFNIACRIGGLKPNAVVMVVTIRALKMQGGIAKNRLKMENLDGIKKGFANLSKHLENIQLFGLPVVIAINVFPSDTEREVKFTMKICEDIGVPVAVSEVFKKGGEGGVQLAEEVLKALKSRSRFRYLYSLDQPIKEKIEAITTHIYGAKRVVYTVKADRDIEHLHRLELENLPICMAKTQFSLSDDPKLLGRPRGFKITVREVRISAGAGFIVPLTGTITTMPGLPRHPAAERMDIDAHGRISGLF